jgi:hypothetical protein
LLPCLANKIRLLLLLLLLLQAPGSSRDLLLLDIALESWLQLLIAAMPCPLNAAAAAAAAVAGPGQQL